MFASIRRCRMHRGSVDELARRVDESFAEEISAQPGFVSYEFVDCGDGEFMTVSIFDFATGASGSRRRGASDRRRPSARHPRSSRQATPSSTPGKGGANAQSPAGPAERSETHRALRAASGTNSTFLPDHGRRRSPSRRHRFRSRCARRPRSSRAILPELVLEDADACDFDPGEIAGSEVFRRFETDPDARGGPRGDDVAG